MFQNMVSWLHFFQARCKAETWWKGMAEEKLLTSRQRKSCSPHGSQEVGHKFVIHLGKYLEEQ
jgi:hypothetical protein